MEEFSSTGQLVTLGLVDSSIGAMAKRLALVDVEASIAKDWLCSNPIHYIPRKLINLTTTTKLRSLFRDSIHHWQVHKVKVQT